MYAVSISGSPRSPSKSKALAEVLLAELEGLGCRSTMIDLATLPADALAARAPSPAVDEAIASVGGADLVIAASPTYRALYTGLLKCFFDLMPQSHLAGKRCIGLQTGIAPHHALSPEYGLRPLFASLDGVPVSVLYATDDEFFQGRLTGELSERLRALARLAVRA